MVDVDGQEVEQVPIGFSFEAAGAHRADVDRMVGYLDGLEVRARVERVLRLGEVGLPDRRVGIAAAWGALVLTGLTVRIDEGEVRVQSRVRLVVDEVDLAGISG